VFLPAEGRCCNHLDAFLELAIARHHPNVRLTERESIYSIDYPLLAAVIYGKLTNETGRQFGQQTALPKSPALHFSKIYMDPDQRLLFLEGAFMTKEQPL
jgi:hypothetical protein